MGLWTFIYPLSYISAVKLKFLLVFIIEETLEEVHISLFMLTFRELEDRWWYNLMFSDVSSIYFT